MRDVAYIALGSNLGDRAKHLAAARAALAKLPKSRVLGVTEEEETPAFGPVGQGPYFNQMVALETGLEPRDLLRHLHEIENSAQRARNERWGPRTLDLDIVKFDRQTIDEPDLTVPHLGLPDRDFWQRQLAELTAKHGRSEGQETGPKGGR